MKAHPTFAGAAVWLSLFLLTTTTALADDAPSATELAQKHFKVGVALYEERDFAGAQIEFRRANEIVPSFKILYNLGQVSQDLHDWAGALRYFVEYLQKGSDNLSVVRQAEVGNFVEELKARVARVKVKISGGPAQLFVDDEAVATSPGQAITVNPGKRRLAVVYPGQTPVAKVLEVASGDEFDVHFVHPRPTVHLPDHELRKTPETVPLSGRSHAAIWTWAATGVVGVTAVASGLMARSESRALARERARVPVDPAVLSWQQHRTASYARATDILIAGGAALALVATYLTLRSTEPTPDPESIAMRAPSALTWTF